MRDEKGKWLAGTSPNPGGRPKGSIQRVRAICQESAEELVRELINIALNPQERARDRISAVALVLDRGLGKAVSSVVEEPQDQRTNTEKIMELVPPALRLMLREHRKEQVEDRSMPQANLLSADETAKG